MRAVTFAQYGPPSVMRVEDIAPREPGPKQIRVSAKAWALNAADWHIMMADPWLARLGSGLFKPKFNVLGADFAGVVEAVGPGVTSLKAGDEVMGELSAHQFGAWAEQVIAPEAAVVIKPANISFEEAAAAPLAGLTAIQALRQGKLNAGERVLIHGASGGVGTFALQIAKAQGAQVTAVCSPRGAEQARQLGADEVIDYTKDDFSQRQGAWDLILACNGDRRLDEYSRALAKGGRYLMVGGTWRQMKEVMIWGGLKSLGSGKKLGFAIAKSDPADLAHLRALPWASKSRSVIDRQFPFAKASDAMAYLLEGHAKGKVVLVP